MSRYVTVSVLSGSRTISFDLANGYGKAVDKMIEFWDKQLDKVTCDHPDIIVLPEVCDRFNNFSKKERIEYYRYRGNKIRDFFREKAALHNCYIAYSAVRTAKDGKLRNSTQIIDRTGDIAGIYNKNHLVTHEYDESGILYGKDAPIIECDFGKVACAICFDLNFDELRQKYVKKSPELLLFSSMYHGDFMQQYWAYSCGAYFAGAISGLESRIIDPLGQILAASTNYYDYVSYTINLDYIVCHLDNHREKFYNIRHKYENKVNIKVPKHLSPALLTSECDQFSIQDIKKEYKLKELTEYLDQSLAHRNLPGHIEKQEELL